jgi:hypothetical protein
MNSMDNKPNDVLAKLLPPLVLALIFVALGIASMRFGNYLVECAGSS